MKEPKTSQFFILISFASATLIIFISFLAFLPGITGALYYDDYGNLEKLGKAQDLSSAWDFISSGFAGPLGRPIALLSFLPHSSGWPDNSAQILLVNVIIHLTNAILLGILSFQLLRLATRFELRKTFWVALTSATLWAVLPLLASTTLIAIQRMTSISALFTLMSLIGFVAVNNKLTDRPWLAVVFSMMIISAGTLLAILSKETGALTPTYALVISIFFLRDKQASKFQSTLRNAILFIALFIILYYLSPFSRDWLAVVDFRGWSPWERLQTQSVLLWEYLRLAAFPLPSAFSPFGDAYPNHAGQQIVWLSTLAWCVVLAISLWLNFAKKIIWPAFALLWFIGGHLLESSTITLEFRFEHRNYLPIYGFVLAMSAGAFSIRGSMKRIIPSLFVCYVALQGLILYAVTSLWGEPLVAANTWVERNPGSLRALTHLVLLDTDTTGVDVADANYRVIHRQRQEYQLSLLERTGSVCPECINVHLEALNLSCELNKQDNVLDRLDSATNLARKGLGRSTTLFPTIDALFRARDNSNAGKCGVLTSDKLLPVTEALLNNNYFSSEHLQTRLMFLAAALSEDIGDKHARDRYLEMAEKTSPQAMPVLEFQVHSAVAEGRRSDALAAIARRRRLVTRGSAMSDARLDALESEVLQK